MEMDIVALVSNLGFPIAVCVYFAVRLEGVLKKTQEIIENNTAALSAFRVKGCDFIE